MNASRNHPQKNDLRHNSHRTCVAILLLLLASVGTFSGCGYMVGGAYQTQVRSVHVPIFKNNTFRRGIEYQLTEAVQKQIKTRTPFHLAKEPVADTRLTGRIINVRKDLLGETGFDDPRELQYSLAVEVTWEDLRSGEILSRQRVPIAPEYIGLVTQSEFAPEVGQSLATSTQEAVDRMARQIVEMMETPW